MDIRLQKRIADSGYCSRRKAEALMEAGKVRVNGELVKKLGSKVKLSDKISVEGKNLKFEDRKVTIVLHKPEGYVTSKSDPHHSKTIMKLLPKEYQTLKPVGRLDKDTEGLLLLSSDGDLIQKLTHPSNKHSKTYEALIRGVATEKDLEPLLSGKLKLDDYTLNPMKFKILKRTKDRKTWIRLILSEGRNRQIRRIMDSIGFPVIYLKRISIGKFHLDKLMKGDHKELTQQDIDLALS